MVIIGDDYNYVLIDDITEVSENKSQVTFRYCGAAMETLVKDPTFTEQYMSRLSSVGGLNGELGLGTELFT